MAKNSKQNQKTKKVPSQTSFFFFSTVLSVLILCNALIRILMKRIESIISNVIAYFLSPFNWVPRLVLRSQRQFWFRLHLFLCYVTVLLLEKKTTMLMMMVRDNSQNKRQLTLMDVRRELNLDGPRMFAILHYLFCLFLSHSLHSFSCIKIKHPIGALDRKWF